MDFLSADPSDVRAEVLEEFVDSNTLLGVFKFTLRPVPDGFPIQLPSTHSRISLADDASEPASVELDERATDLLVNVIRKDGHHLQVGEGRDNNPSGLGKTLELFLLVVKGALAGRRRDSREGSEVDWSQFKRQFAGFIRRREAIDPPRDLNGRDA